MPRQYVAVDFMINMQLLTVGFSRGTSHHTFRHVTLDHYDLLKMVSSPAIC